MHTCLKLSTLTVAIAAASGCASVDPAGAWRVVGHQSVRHAASATDADAQYALGKYYLGQGRAALALIAFTRAIEYDSRHADAYNGRATALVQLGDLDRAAEDVARALELSPRSAHLLNNQGFIRIQQRDFEGAAASLKQAFEIEPRNERVVANWRLLASRVSNNPALARRLEAPDAPKQPGLAQAAAPKPTASVVETLSKAMSDPVINLAYPAPVAASAPAALPIAVVRVPGPAESAPPTAPALSTPTPAPSTTVVDLAHASANTSLAQPEAAGVTVAPAATSASDAIAADATPAFAPAHLSVVDIPAAHDTAAPQAATTVTIPAAATPATVTVAAMPAPAAPDVTRTVDVATAPAIPAAAEATRTVDVAAMPETPATAAMAPTPGAAVKEAPAPTMTVAAPVARGAVIDVAKVLQGARIEVANGNGVRGMAASVGSQLRRHDFKVVHVANADHFAYPRTRIYFRDGYLEAALRLGRTLATRPAVMLDTTMSSRSDLRVVIGRDLPAQRALADKGQPVAPLALAGDAPEASTYR